MQCARYTDSLLMCGCICAAVKPQGKLLSHLTALTEEQRAYVFYKLAASDYAESDFEDLADTLTNDILKDLGIEPPLLRGKLLRALALSGR